MKNKLLLILLFVCVSSITLLVGNGVTQSFQMLYAKQIQFEYNGAGVILSPGVGLKAVVNTVTLPDETVTIDTDANNYNRLLTSLKAIDVSKGSHSGINWTSFGH